MRAASVASIPEISRAASFLIDWLRKNVPTVLPETYDRMEPGLGNRRCVGWIVYEGVARDRWDESWFQDGIVALTLMALERERKIVVQVDNNGDVVVVLTDDERLPLSAFIAGDTLRSQKEDPDLADLDWRVVPTMARILAELE